MHTLKYSLKYAPFLGSKHGHIQNAAYNLATSSLVSVRSWLHLTCVTLQIEDAFYHLPNPYPEEQIVGVIKQTLAVVDESGRQVPLSEVTCIASAWCATTHCLVSQANNPSSGI